MFKEKHRKQKFTHFNGTKNVNRMKMFIMRFPGVYANFMEFGLAGSELFL